MSWECIGHITALVSVIIGVVTYVCDKVIERRNLTIEKVGNLLDEYHDKYKDLTIREHYQEHVRFLSRIEQFCIAVDSGVYSRWIIKKFGSKFLSSIYEKYKDNVIQKRRQQFGEDNYRYLADLVNSFR